MTWNKKEFVLALLDSLARHPYPNWEVLVVDNCSSDRTEEAVRERHPWVTYLTTPVNLGGSGGFNAGLCAMLKRGGYDYLWLLDNDVVVEPGALEVLVETLESRPDAAIAGSHMIQLDRPGITNEIGGDVDLATARLLLCWHNSLSWRHRDEIFEVDYVAAASLLVRFRVLEEVGIWDDLFIHYDDVDWCLRIRDAGYVVLACASSRIRHLSANVKCVTWIIYYDIRNILYLQSKHARFGIGHYLYFSLLLLLYSMRDELCGKSYYAQLIEMALLDFFSGRMGKRQDLPVLATEPVRDVLARIVAEQPRAILVLEPTRRVVYSEEDLDRLPGWRERFLGVCHERETDLRALPHQARRLRLSRRRPLMALQILRLWLFSRRADYLILDIDRVSGLIGLCARKIVLIVDDRCLVVTGGFGRLLRTVRWPFRWLRVVAALFYFTRTRGHGRGAAAVTAAEFEQRLAALGGTLEPVRFVGDLGPDPSPDKSSGPLPHEG